MAGLADRGLAALFGRIPPWQYLLAGAVVAGAGHWLSEVEVLEPLRALTGQLLADLQMMNPVNATLDYYRDLYAVTARCGIVFEHGAAHKVCSLWNAIGHWGFTDWLKNLILMPLIMLYQVAVDVWTHSSWMGRIVYLATLPMGLAGALALVTASGDDWPDEWTPIGWAMFALAAAPCVAFAALALQGWLIILLWVFGKALAAIVWTVSVIGGPIAFYHQVTGVVKQAREIEEGVGKLNG